VKKATVLAAMLVAAPVFAQSASDGLEARIQLFGEFSRPREFSYNETFVKAQADNQVGIGIRLMGEIPGTTGWFYEVGGRLDSSSKLGTKYTDSLGVTWDTTDIQFKYSYFSIGGAYLWNSGPLSVGFHLEGRGEALRLQGEEWKQTGAAPQVSGGKVDQSCTYFRPWARVSVDFTMKASGVRPYVGADVSLAITQTSQTRATPVSNGGLEVRTLRAMAPQFAAGVYAGIRF
jgi:hypothetical protein